MGLGNHGTGMKYVNVSMGKMHFKDENGEKQTADYLEGVILGISTQEDTFEGKPTTKVLVDMRDGLDEFRLQFTLDAWFSVGFFARIKEIDLKLPVKIGVMQSEKNEKVSFCFMKQGAKKIEKSADAVRPEKVTVGKGAKAKEVIDFSGFGEYADKIMKDLNEKLSGKVAVPAQVETKKEDDDLPF